jgi:hypothetical protein
MGHLVRTVGAIDHDAMSGTRQTRPRDASGPLENGRAAVLLSRQAFGGMMRNEAHFRTASITGM